MPEKKPLTEDEAFEIALNDHPDLRKRFLKGKLPDEMFDDQGNAWNPRLHLDIHAIIERQIANDEPRGIAEIARQLAEAGVDRHEIRHLLAQPATNQMWHMMKEGRPYDEEQHLRELRKILKKHQRRP